jgi:hypothetical protein
MTLITLPFIKKVSAVLILLTFSNCALKDKDQDKNQQYEQGHDTQTNLYEKYHSLLSRALNETDTNEKTFSHIRLRCDLYVMKWIDEALYSIYEKKPFNPHVPTSGMSNIKDLETDPNQVIKRFLREEELCGIKNYINRVKTTLPGETNETEYSELELLRIKKLISDLEKMNVQLALVFNG